MRLLRGAVLGTVFVLAVCSASVLACLGHAFHVPDAVDVRVASPSVEELVASFSDAPLQNARRSQRLLELFHEAGCADAAVEAAGRTPEDNVICTLPGESPATIVVAANIDRSYDGTGLIDNWTGASLLPLLYRALAIEPRHHTFVFAGFANAVLRQRGSRGYLRRIGRKGRAKIRAMVNLKALGVGSTAVWHTQSDANLVEDLYSVAMAMDLPPLRFQNFYSHAVTDARSFRYWGIPTITIHSLDQESARVLSEPIRDGRTLRVDPVLYQANARLIAVFLGYIDRTVDLRSKRAAG